RPPATTSSHPQENHDDHQACRPCARRGIRLRFRRARDRTGLCRRFEHALGATAQPNPRKHPGPGREGDLGHRDHRHRPDAGVRRDERWLPSPHPDRVRPQHRLRSVELLPDVLPVRWRSDGVMEHDGAITGFYAPVHRALTEPILLGGAPRAVAIVNGTLAAAIGLGLRLWIAGGLIWLIGHIAAVWAAKRDAAFVDVVRRHLRYPQHLVS